MQPQHPHGTPALAAAAPWTIPSAIDVNARLIDGAFAAAEGLAQKLSPIMRPVPMVSTSSSKTDYADIPEPTSALMKALYEQSSRLQNLANAIHQLTEEVQL